MTKILHTATITFHSLDDSEDVALSVEMSDQPDADYIPSAHNMVRSLVMSIRNSSPVMEFGEEVNEHLTNPDLTAEQRAINALTSITAVESAVVEVL